MVVSPTSQEGALQVASARYTVAPACAAPVTRLCEGVTAAAMDDYRSALAVAHSHPWSWLLCPQPPGDPKCLASCTEIGIGLTGAGLLFMVLGMMMFFDKGLLAMGNVRRVPSGPRLDLAALLCSRPPLCVCRSCSLRVS